MSPVDLHIHPYSHEEDHIKNMYSNDYLEEFIAKAREKNVKFLGFSDHDIYINKIDWKGMSDLKNRINDINLLIGIEFDYLPEKEELIRKKLTNLNLDYSIGSVHHIEDWSFDHPDYQNEYKNRNIIDIYYKYFNLVKEMARSGLFDIVGHLDLIKVFGYRPENKSIINIVEPILQEIKTNSLVIEINTNGLNKPVKEIYPALNILKRAFEYKIPITFGSDAHRPGRVGEGLDKVLKLIKDIGYQEFVVFIQGEKQTVPF